MATEEIEQIKATIAALEAQRPALGDTVVETALAPLREKLAVLTRSAAPADERKRVTVLFADVRGYTPLSETLDPEDVTAIMNQLFDAVTAEITRYEGTVDKYSGDAVMALFGAPRALENHEEMAVRAALAMHETIEAFSARLRQEWGFGVSMRIGLNTGEVLAGMVGARGARSYTVMGDTVNLASRLEHACSPGRVMVSAETARRLHTTFDFKPPQQITVKGKTEPIIVYVVIGEKARPGRVRGVAGLYAPMVGRDTEMSALQALYERAQAEGRWQVAAIVGEAGIGKSRLRREFVAWIAEARPQARVLTGRCYAHTQATPYHLAADLMRVLLNLGGDVGGEVDPDQLSQALRALDPTASESELQYRLGSLAGVLGLALSGDVLQSLDPEQRRNRTFLSLERLLLAASAVTPLVVVVEDLHWTDALSLSFLRHFLQLVESGLVRGQKGLLLHISRPAETTHGPLAAMLQQMAQPPHRTLALQPLDAAQSSDLVGKLLAQADIPPEMSTLVARQAQGNPFFVEEILRSLIEDGTLVHDPQDAQWHTTRPVTEVRVPDTIQGVLAARLDRLPAEDKIVAQHAAIIGRTFWQHLLAEIALEPDASDRIPTIEAALARLEERQLVLRLSQSQIAEDWEWIFRHVLTQEVAYSSVPKAVRRRVHGQVARWLEARAGEQAGPLIPVIGYHYERGQVPEKALVYLRRAGEQALGQFANEDAVEYFSRALELLAQVNEHAAWLLEQQYALLLGRERASGLLARREFQLADLTRLASLAQELDQTRSPAHGTCRAEIALRQAAYCDAVSDFPAALQAAQDAVGWAERAGDRSQKVEGLIAGARALWRQGAFADAREQLLAALALAREQNDRPAEAKCLHHLGTVLYFLGDPEGARDHLEQALFIRRVLGDRWREASSLNNLAGVYHAIGDVAQAKRFTEQVLAAHQAIGDRRNETQALNNLGNIYYALGELEIARDHQERTVTLFRLIGDRLGEALAHKSLGQILADMGDDEAARKHCLRALELDQDTGSRSGQGDSLTYLGMALEGLGELEAAEEAYQRALDLRRDMGQVARTIDDLAGLARVAQKQGRLDRAQALIGEILDWIADHDVRTCEYPIRIFLTCADVLKAAGLPGQASAVLDQAQTLLQDQAGRISDPAARRTFLEQVPLHRQLRERLSQ